MTDASGRFTVVYSGEVYNYRELRAEYERAGARFRTQSDTEVVLEGFRLRGRNVCRELNGMFAFAVWDAGRQELVLARDEIGKKPLFWFEAGDSVWFASTLDAFADVRAWNGRLSDVSVALYSALGSIPADRTIYEQGLSLTVCLHRRCVGPLHPRRATGIGAFSSRGRRDLAGASSMRNTKNC